MTPNTKPAEHLPGILPHHLKRFRASGLSDDMIRAAGLYSETSPEKLAALLGWRKPTKRLAPAIVIPFTSADGRNGYCRIRPDTPRKIKDKPVKYESPKGQPNQIYIPPGVAPLLEDSQRELCITEGEFKATSATQAGFPTLGLIGVFGWKPKRGEQLLPELERVAWEGRPIRIVFDSDLERKPDVQSAEARLAKHLTDRGAIVRCVRLPDGAAGEDGQPTKMGLDDFLVAHGLGPFRKLLDAAIEPEPLEGAEGKRDAGTIDPGTEAKAYLKSLEFDGLSKLRYWHDTPFVWTKGAYRQREQSEVRADVLRYLDHGYNHLLSGAVSCVLDHIRAHGILPSDTEPGSWIGERPADWEPDEILSTPRKIIHLPTLASNGDNATLPATTRLFTTAAVDFEFNPRAPRPDMWLNFLELLWGDDSAAIGTLQEWIGYLLTCDTRQQKIALLMGPRRSGKGTIGRVIRELVGHANVAGPTLATLATNFGLESLLGKSVGIISDARLSNRTDSAIVIERLLSISGEDCLTIDRKHTSHVTVKLPTRLMILTNELPRMADTSGALASRFVVLRLRESFLGREDRLLFDKLRIELPGILLWAIEGWRRLRERGYFEQPNSSDELADELADLTSPIGAFVRERCTIENAANVPRARLYAEYRAWAESKGRDHIEDEAGFGRGLRAAVPMLGDSQPRVAGEKVRHYTGIGLNW